MLRYVEEEQSTSHRDAFFLVVSLSLRDATCIGIGATVKIALESEEIVRFRPQGSSSRPSD